MTKVHAELFATEQGKKIIQNSTEMREIMVVLYSKVLFVNIYISYEITMNNYSSAFINLS